ncbi:hypothetical protein BH09PSE6_BH09PSE6_16870 [soil metagenome]
MLPLDRSSAARRALACLLAVGALATGPVFADSDAAAAAPRAGDGPMMTPSLAAAPGSIAPIGDADLWDRIRRGFQVPDLTGPLVDRKEEFYLARPEHVLRVSERARRYLYQIVEEVEKRGMPTEIALLPFIESSFNPMALSRAKALGMWQFMPATGRDFGLRQNLFQDDRRNVVESTRAALSYLDKLHDMFGDWHLAFAAYNWGEGAVSRAIESNRKKGLPTDYESLRMPDETRAYVPSLQAVKNIVADPAQFNLQLPRIDDAENYVAIGKTGDIDVRLAAQFAGLTLDEFRSLNPSFHQPIIVAANQPQIVLPKDRVEQFLDNLSFFEGQLSSFTAYVLRTGETLDNIGSRFGISAAALRDLNSIPANARPKAGSTLIVPRVAAQVTDIPQAIAETASLSFELPRAGKAKPGKVGKGGKADTATSRTAGRTRVAASSTQPVRAKAVSTKTSAARTKAVARKP